VFRDVSRREITESFFVDQFVRGLQNVLSCIDLPSHQKNPPFTLYSIVHENKENLK